MNNHQDIRLNEIQSYFNSLQLITPQFKDFLQQFRQPKPVEAFYAGVQKFMVVALLCVEQRQTFYGSRFGGLHFSDDLENLWTTVFLQIPIVKDDFIRHTLSHWTYCLSGYDFALMYTGTQPSQALNQLIQGPSVIDCGMFCQLSIWFGMRYVMGDIQFDSVFGKKPFYLTQYNFQAIPDDGSYAGTPLWSLLSKPRKNESHGLLIHYIYNLNDYPIKHPTGSTRGENCIVINDKYYIFNASLKNQQGLSKNEIYEFLMRSYNKSAQTDAEKFLISLRGDSNKINDCFDGFVVDAKIYTDSNLLLEYALNRQKQLKTHQFTLEQFIDLLQLEELNPGRNDHISHIMFDLEKFKQLLPRQSSLSFFKAADLLAFDHELTCANSYAHKYTSIW